MTKGKKMEERVFYRVEHGGNYKGHFSDKDCETLEEAMQYREEIKGKGNVEFWNKVYEVSRVVKVTEIIEEIK